MKTPTTVSGMVATPTKANRKSGLASLIIRMPRAKLKAVQALAKETRILQSTLLREAVEDMMVKRNCMKRGGA